MTRDHASFDKPIYSLPGFLRDLTRVAGVGPTLARVYLTHSIDPALRERMWVAVSAANQCRYCSFVHRGWAKAVGVNDAEIEALAHHDLSLVERRVQVATDYLLTWVARDFAEPGPALRKPLEALFTASQRDALRSIARLCTLNNLTGNSFDAFLSRLRGAPAHHSRALDEAILSAIFLTAAACVIPGLVWAERKNAPALLEHFRVFSRRFDAAL